MAAQAPHWLASLHHQQQQQFQQQQQLQLNHHQHQQQQLQSNPQEHMQHLFMQRDIVHQAAPTPDALVQQQQQQDSTGALMQRYAQQQLAQQQQQQHQQHQQPTQAQLAMAAKQMTAQGLNPHLLAQMQANGLIPAGMGSLAASASLGGMGGMGMLPAGMGMGLGQLGMGQMGGVGGMGMNGVGMGMNGVGVGGVGMGGQGMMRPPTRAGFDPTTASLGMQPNMGMSFAPTPHQQQQQQAPAPSAASPPQHSPTHINGTVAPPPPMPKTNGFPVSAQMQQQFPTAQQQQSGPQSLQQLREMQIAAAAAQQQQQQQQQHFQSSHPAPHTHLPPPTITAPARPQPNGHSAPAPHPPQHGRTASGDPATLIMTAGRAAGLAPQHMQAWLAQLRMFKMLERGEGVEGGVLEGIRFRGLNGKTGGKVEPPQPGEMVESKLGKRKEKPGEDDTPAPKDEEAAPEQKEKEGSPAKRARIGEVDGKEKEETAGGEGGKGAEMQVDNAEPAAVTVEGPAKEEEAAVSAPTAQPTVPAPAVSQPAADAAPAPAVSTTAAPAAAVAAPPPVVHPPPPYLLEEDKNSGIYPYNAFVHPTQLIPPGSRRVGIPSLLPHGLGVDPYAVAKARDHFLDGRMDWRAKELREGAAPTKDAPVHGSYTSAARGGKAVQEAIRAMIERKGLELRQKQRKLRQDVVIVMHHATALPGTSVIDREVFRRQKRPELSAVRNLEKMERKQRHAREGRARAAHRAELEVICQHGRDMSVACGMAQAKAKRFGQKIAQFHQVAEKEEQKRVERISKERLKALKADDEEAYLRLIDTAKDTRITHLLKQTDSYLDSLAMMVRAQQNDDVHREVIDRELRERGELGELELEEGPANEATFGATRQDDPAEDSGKVDYYAVAHSISEKVSQQPRMLVGGTLKDYQLKGLQWMVSLYNNRLNGILADEMGLGKTIQTISLITFLIEKKRQLGPYLVIVPLSTLTNWSMEFEKWAPDVRTLVYKGSPNARKALGTQVRQGHFQVLLTTYEYIIKDRTTLCRPKWVHMIIDEGHRLKNVQSKLSVTLSQFYVSRYRLILTGTPLQNNLPELWALLNFVLPKIFNSVKSFDEWFNMPFANTGTQDKIELNEEEQLLIIRRLHKVLRPFLLRRLKKDVESELPDKVEKVIKCKMSALQAKLYGQMKSEGILYSEKTDAKGRPMGMKGLSNVIMQLRKICNHPFVFEEVESVVNPSKQTDNNLWRVAGKFELLDRIIPKLLAGGHRMLVFFQMTLIMDIMEDYMRMRGYSYLRLDGGTKQEDRQMMLQKFNEEDSKYDLFLLSTRAGGLGLNLQTADTVIIFDSDWNPHADLQAQDRAHRIGQKKAVCILRLVTQNSFEEEILDRARGKLDIDGKVIQAGRFDNKSTNEERERFLRSMLEQDHEQTEESGEMNDDEINEILARGGNELEIFRKMDLERERKAEHDWRASGGRGPKPERLMQESELPEIYRRERVPSLLESDILEGRGSRVRGPVRYTDGLTDEQFSELIDNEDIDFDEYMQQKEERRNKRAVNKAAREAAQSQNQSESPPPEEPSSKKKGKGRPSKKKEPEWKPSTPSSSKRKRGDTKDASIAPSFEEDEEEPDAKRRKLPLVISSNVRERMRAVFNECYQAVAQCVDEDGRKRWDLFKEPPSKKLYPNYYTMIPNVIAMSTIRKRMQSSYYKAMTDFRDNFHLMFDNARKFNQEGSVVYNDADEMQSVFDATYYRLTVGTDLPGAEAAPAGSKGESAVDDEDEEQEFQMPARGRGGSRKRSFARALSEEEFMDSDMSEEE